MLSPAIHFNGYCAEAIELYKKAFDAKVINIDYYEQAPEGSGLYELARMHGKIMHSNLMIYDSLVNMSDSDEPVSVGSAICLNVFVPDAADVKRAYEALREEGSVAVDLGPQFFSPMYAAVLDKFGIRWQIIVQ